MSELDDLEQIADLLTPSKHGDGRSGTRTRAQRECWKRWRAQQVDRVTAENRRRAFYARSNSEPRSPGTGERGSE